MRLHVHIPDQLAEELSERAKTSERTLAAVVREVLQEGLRTAPATPTTTGTTSAVFRCVAAPDSYFTDVQIFKPVQTRVKDEPKPAFTPPHVYFTSDEVRLLSAQGTCRALGIPYDSLLDDLDEEDLHTELGETCIADFGVQAAIAIAKTWEVPTSRFEQWYAEIQQDPHQ